MYSRIKGDIMGRDMLKVSEVEFCINKLLESDEEGDEDRARILTLTKSIGFIKYINPYIKKYLKMNYERN